MSIHQLAEAGKLAALRAALEAGANVEQGDAEGRTPLMVAAGSSQAGVEVLELLVGHGANVNAQTGAKPALVLDEFTKQALAEAGADPALFAQAAIAEAGESVLADAVKHDATIDKLRFLIRAGADVHFQSNGGYSLLLKSVYRSLMPAADDWRGVVDLFIDAGVSLNAASSHGETPLGVASGHGKFDVVNHLLARGADAAVLSWTPLCFAIASGNVDEVTRLLDAGVPLESRDHRQRTPFLLAVQAGDVPTARLLVARGCNIRAVAHCDETALLIASSQTDPQMLQWLIGLGLDLEQTDEFGTFPLLEAVQQGAAPCVQTLIAAGADAARRDRFDDQLLESASDPDVIRLLVRSGAELSDLRSEARVTLLGAKAEASAVSPAVFAAHRYRKFGKTNPEPMNNPLWNWQVASRENAYQCMQRFGQTQDWSSPTWCFQRFGQSLTELPDGRFVEIAGEHEDHYDPDFCIYNDVVVHERGSFTIYGYPEKVFPPTDFHSATLDWPYIYVIGNLGYPAQRRHGNTPVFRLNCTTWAMEAVKTRGKAPGWIFNHRARLVDNQIVIRGGEILVDRKSEPKTNEAEFVLDLAHFTWTRR